MMERDGTGNDFAPLESLTCARKSHASISPLSQGPFLIPADEPPSPAAADTPYLPGLQHPLTQESEKAASVSPMWVRRWDQNER